MTEKKSKWNTRSLKNRKTVSNPLISESENITKDAFLDLLRRISRPIKRSSSSSRRGQEN